MASTHISNNLYTSENANLLAGKRQTGHVTMAKKSALTTRTALGSINNTNRGLASTRPKLEGRKTAQTELKPETKSTTTPAISKTLRDTVELKCEHMDPHTLIIEAPPRPDSVRDIDTDDAENPQLVSEYINEIYIYLRLLEDQQSVRKDYMQGYQITPRMRLILVDWLVQVHQRFHLLQETLYLTIAIIDRFLQDGEISKSKLQLVGVTAMWIASKYEEMYAPEVNDFVYITDNAYTKANIRQMERIILKRLNFDLGRPLPLHFLRRYSKAGEVDSTKHTLAKYLLELSILDYELVHYRPSEVSAACLCMSMKLLDEDDCQWDETLTFYSTYSEEHLQPIMNRLALLVYKSPTTKQQAVKQKYQSSKFMRISTIEELQCSIIEEWAENAAKPSSS